MTKLELTRRTLIPLTVAVAVGVAVAVEAGAQTLLKEAGGRVERGVHDALVARERIPRFAGNPIG